MLNRRYTTGFTLVELVVVLVLLGVLSAYAAPRFSGRSGYSELAVRQDIKQAIRYAQQLAMSRTDENFSFVATSNQIDVHNAGSTLAGNYPVVLSDATLSPVTLNFDRLGATTAGITRIRATGPSNQFLDVCVNGTTGYAYDC